MEQEKEICKIAFGCLRCGERTAEGFLFLMENINNDFRCPHCQAVFNRFDHQWLRECLWKLITNKEQFFADFTAVVNEASERIEELDPAKVKLMLEKGFAFYIQQP